MKILLSLFSIFCLPYLFFGDISSPPKLGGDLLLFLTRCADPPLAGQRM